MGENGNIDAKPDDRESCDESVKPKLKRKEYEKVLRELQTELCSVQEWVKRKGQRTIVVFEGRDAAGKGGTIRAMTERVSPRTFRVVALPAPSDREKSQMYVRFHCLRGSSTRTSKRRFCSLGADLQEAFMLLLSGESHHIFDPGTVVPTAVKDHDFSCGGKVREVALQ